MALLYHAQQLTQRNRLDPMHNFDDIYQRAAQRKGGEAALESLLSHPLSNAQLRRIPGDKWLEEFTRKVFQSGFYWQVINNKWPGFREVFWDFNIEKLLRMPPEMLEQKASDERIVRNFNKVKTVPLNAAMIYFHHQDHGQSFSQFIADFPTERIVELWAYLKQHGARLGGNTGVYALRALGKDTFILSRDIEAHLRANDIITGGLQSKRSLAAIQHYFNELQQHSGRSLQQLSQLIAFSVGDNYVGVGDNYVGVEVDRVN